MGFARGVICVLVLAIAALSVTAARGLPILSGAEQDEIAIALLRHDAPTHPVYLSIRGHDPSPVFLARLENAHYRPCSLFENHKPDEGAMGLVVGSFILRSANTAEANLRQVCGALCGCIEKAEMVRIGGKWSVDTVTDTVCS